MVECWVLVLVPTRVARCGFLIYPRDAVRGDVPNEARAARRISIGVRRVFPDTLPSPRIIGRFNRSRACATRRIVDSPVAANTMDDWRRVRKLMLGVGLEHPRSAARTLATLPLGAPIAVSDRGAIPILGATA